MKDVTWGEIIVGVLLGLAFIFVFILPVFATEYQFKTIAVPEAAHTWSFGINESGDVVGMFSDDVGPFIRVQGFLFSDGKYYDLGINLDGAASVVAYGINRDGVIAGGFHLPNIGNLGFIMDAEQTTILDGARRAEGINNRGAVVGYREVGATNQQAYKWKDGVYTTINTPGLLSVSSATGISGKNVVGYYSTDGITIHGFIIKAGELSSVDIIPLGVNRDGVMVGYMGAGFDAAVLENGIVQLIKYPGAEFTQIHGINNKGHLVGYYQKGGATFGFVAKPGTKVQK